MEFSLTTITPPDELPISMSEMRSHSALCNGCDDVQLAGMIAAAVNYFEDQTNRRLLTQTVRLALDRYPGGVFDLPVGPVSAIVSAEVRNATSDAGVQTFTAIDTPALVGNRVQRAYWSSTANASLPSIDCGPESLRLTLTCGYGVKGASCPPVILGCLKLLAAHFYENREASIVGTTASVLPFGVPDILAQYRIPVGAGCGRRSPHNAAY